VGVSDRYDRAVTGILAVGVLGCLVAVGAARTAPLPAADGARWIAIADRAGGSGKHVFRRTWQIDAFDAGASHLDYSDQPPAVRRGDRFAVSGWAIDPVLRRSPVKVEYRLDGGAWHQARSHIARPDVAVALSLSGAGDTGYAAEIATAALAPGPHELELATAGRGGLAPMSPAVRFVVSAP